MITIKIQTPRILGLREIDCQPTNAEYNTARWSGGESKAKAYALSRAKQLNATHGGKLEVQLAALHKAPPAQLWNYLERDWAEPQEWAVTI